MLPESDQNVPKIARRFGTLFFPNGVISPHLVTLLAAEKNVFGLLF
jgi:hypothetical protein